MNRLFQALALLCSFGSAAAGAQGAIQDNYGPIVEWRQPSGMEVTPIHVGLLPNGTLFFVNNFNFFESPGLNLRAPGFDPEFMFLMQTTPADVAPPASVQIQPLPNAPSLTPRYDAATNSMRFKTLSCSGHALTADGRLFFASGPDATVNVTLYDSGQLLNSLSILGIAESVTYDPASGAWTENPNMVVPGPETGAALRWYATVTRLADTRMLVTGGYEKVFPRLAYNAGVEIFDPARNVWSAVSAAHDTPPGIENPDYTHAFQMPYAFGSNPVLMIGGSGEAIFLFMTGQERSWLRTEKFRPGARELLVAGEPFPNDGASTALLPIRLPESGWGYGNGSVINVSGAHGSALEGRLDVYDPLANAWRSSVALHGPRHHPSTVILPDGRILLLAGYDDESAVSKAGYAEYVDPGNGFSVTQGSAYMPEVRGYHAVTVLLPDGRVLVGGGNLTGEDARERSDFRYYYPDYMFKPRPRMVSSADTLRTASHSLITVPHGTRIGEAALVGLGSMTHSFDMNQRHVQLRVFDAQLTVRPEGAGWVPVSAAQCQADPANCHDLHVIHSPLTEEIAPPGHYMLFILDENRVPSVGRIVKLEGRHRRNLGALRPPGR